MAITPPAPALAGKVVLISGGGSGIGAAGAAELLRRGAHPVLFDRDAAALASTRAALGGDVLAIEGDVLDAASCADAVARCVARHGGVDVVWANAGIGTFGFLAQGDPHAWLGTIDINVCGVFRFVHAALPQVLARRGIVAVTASLASFAHAPGMSAYGASKAAVEAMCDSWRIELAAHGVQVTAIHPSWITTPMLAGAAAQSKAFARLRRTMPPPLRRESSPEVLARAVADAFERRSSRVFVPGFVRWMFALRSLLHLKPLERDMLAAAPEMERLYAEDQAAGLGAAMSTDRRAA